MPKNTFHRLQNVLESRGVNPETAVRALMASVFIDCCNDCNEKLRDEEFVKGFERLLDDLLRVQQLSQAA